MSDKKRPYYDPEVARQFRFLCDVAELVAKLPKEALELGKCIVIPNKELTKKK